MNELHQTLLETLNVGDGHIVGQAAGSRENDKHLFLDRERRKLSLFQNFGEPLAARELRLRRLIQLVGPELREGREFAVLREVQPQRPGHLPHGSICALPPTRLTERPTLIAGRMPLLNKCASR